MLVSNVICMLGIAALAWFMHKLHQNYQAFYELYRHQLVALGSESEHEEPPSNEALAGEIREVIEHHHRSETRAAFVAALD